MTRLDSPTRTPWRPSTPVLRRLGWSLVVLHAGMLAITAWLDAPTADEPRHLAAGLRNWFDGAFDVNLGNPPVPNLLASAPVWFASSRADWMREAGGLETGWQYAPVQRANWVGWIRVARLASIPFSIVGALVCWTWAGALYGRRGGLVALTLWCFCPNVLGHGHLITCDIPAAACGVLAAWLFWRWLGAADFASALAAGLGVGLALVSKLVWCVYALALPAVWLFWELTRPQSVLRTPLPRRLAQSLVVVLSALCVVNASYAFTSMGRTLTEIPRLQRRVIARQAPGGVMAALAKIPLPLPAPYVQGCFAASDVAESQQGVFIAGHWHAGSVWYYYFYALALKVPLGTWILAALGAAASARRALWPRSGNVAPEGDPTVPAQTGAATGLRPATGHGPATVRDDVALLIPAVAILELVTAVATGFNHARYAYPVLPFLFIWAGGSIEWVSSSRRPIALAMSAGIAAALLWSVGSSLAVFPQSFAYFNELAGGPAQGHKRLINSSIDWGQDLLRLKRWCDQNPQAQPLRLAYFGALDPRDVGISYRAPEPDAFREEATMAPAPGWYAISVNFLQGCAWSVPNGTGGQVFMSRGSCAGLRARQPVARVGSSIWIYHIEPEAEPGQRP